jgi:LAO/AO transport system kinase
MCRESAGIAGRPEADLPAEIERLVAGVLAGDLRSATQLISKIEAADPSAAPAEQALFSRTGRAHVLGVTGPPGAGKSTLVGRLVAGYRARAMSVAVLAVDPSSPDSGGAILGDRLRMGDFSQDSGVFIRSMAARRALGGLSVATQSAVRVLDALGFDRVIVETVGVGQNEIAISNVADCAVVVSIPGAGDAVQAMKSGILEVGDVHVVNKSDRDGADKLYREIRAAVSADAQGRRPRVLMTRSDEGDGVPELVDAVEDFLTEALLDGRRDARRVDSLRKETLQLVATRACERILNQLDDQDLSTLTSALAGRRCDPSTVAERILQQAGSQTETLHLPQRSLAR